jgi:hypothetical protein
VDAQPFIAQDQTFSLPRSRIPRGQWPIVDDGSGRVPPPASDRSIARAQLLTALTTEHFTLQTARSTTVSESSGRATLFLASVTGSVVALAFVGQVSRTGPAFTLFAMALLPTLLLLGLVTYWRLLQSAVEDLTYGLAINRIRAFYLTLDPVAADYLVMSSDDTRAGVLHNMGMHSSRWHLLSHSATVIIVVDAVLAGTMAGLASSLLARNSFGMAGAVGAVTAVIVLALLLLHQARCWSAANQNLATRH